MRDRLEEDLARLGDRDLARAIFSDRARWMYRAVVERAPLLDEYDPFILARWIECRTGRVGYLTTDRLLEALDRLAREAESTLREHRAYEQRPEWGER